ncbi:MAG: TetR/AcrR family transcriptional regulator [Myxococcales bacterium]|nr:TetR/AcrR family transcriptional regulator [Myxococcales bacterium]
MGRKKSEQCRLAILDAARSVMEERGYLDMSIEEVACRAKAGKQTVYRHFGSKPRLALEAFVAKASRLELPDTGSLAGDLGSYLATLVEVMNSPHKRSMLGGLLAEIQGDSELGDAFRQGVIEAKRTALRTVFQRGIARGEVAPDADLEVLVDLVYGPVWYRMLISGGRLDPSFAETLADTVVLAARRAMEPVG